MGWPDVLLWSIFLGSTLVQIYFWGGWFDQLARFQPQVEKRTDQEAPIPVSLVICARNEAENLARNLPLFLNQSYRFLDILVVNDDSSDKTAQVLLDFKQKNPKLRVLHIGNKSTPGKKAALSTGIQAAFFEAILLTDADCIPASPQWIHFMVSGYRQKKGIVLGYSPYLPSRSFLNHFIRFETSYIATQYFSFALAGSPYMGVGRNLMYPKHLFFNQGGFQAHQHLASGDDDLFINRAARYSPTQVVLHPQAFTYSFPKSNWRDYYYQKRRHLSTGSHYRTGHQLALGVLALSHFGHYAGLMLLLVFFPDNWMWSLSTFAVRLGVVMWQYRRILRLLQDPLLLPWIPLMDALYTLHYLVFAPVFFNTGQSRQVTWKQ